MEMTLEDWLEIDEYHRMPTGAGDVAVSCYASPRYKLPVRLYGTELEFGDLRLEYVDEENSTEGLIACDSYGYNLVMHPTAGILNVGIVWGAGDVDPALDLEEVHQRVQADTALLCEELRERQGYPDEPHPLWSQRALPIAPALLLCKCPEVDPAAYGIDPRICTHLDWPSLPDDLRAILDYQDPGHRPLMARDVATAIKTCGHQYMDHVSMASTFEDTAEMLFGRPERRDAA